MREEGLIAAADADDAGDDDDDDDGESVKVSVNDEGEPFMKLNGDNRLTVRKYKSMVLIGKNAYCVRGVECWSVDFCWSVGVMGEWSECGKLLLRLRRTVAANLTGPSTTLNP